jgi:hypothetical protein
MPLGYKYVERDADSQMNWFEVGKGITDMLTEVNRVREEKKAAYEQATRDDMNNLMDAPQGQNQDANTFINNYAHDMINQKKIDYDLFKRGQMSERDYTLRMQNGMDGTKQLFQIQKLYQDNYQKKMEGITSGKLQSMNIFNMSMVEGYGDFNNSKATINPADGTVGIGLMENKIIDGKVVRVLSKNIANVNVIKGKVLQDIPTFDVDAATTKTVANFGTRKDIWYEAATVSGAGSITEYMGVDFLSTLTDPVDKKIVKGMHDAIEQQIGYYFSNPYNLSSVLTENTGKYNDKSYTFDREEADKDPKKILVKVDPNTQLTALDETGKNYKSQYKEAADWVRTDMLSKMDQERSIKTTAQNQLQESAETKERANAKYRAVEPSEPIKVGEILNLTTTDKKGNKNVVGSTQRIENLVFNEGKGIQNVATNITYNHKNGTLELSGYQVTGKESEGRKVEGDGTTGSESSTVIKQTKFVKNDITSAPLLSTMVLKLPNPENPGYNFSNIKEAKSYYKRMYESRAGKKTIQFDAQGNIIN